MKLDCDIVRDLLPGYVEDLVSPKTRRAVEEHLAGCAACGAHCAALRAPEPGPPDAAEDAVVRCLKKLRRERRRAWGLAALAVLLALVCAGGILAANAAYRRGLYAARSPLVGPEQASCTAIGVLPGGELAFCLETELPWDHRLPYIELQEEELQVGLTRSPDDAQPAGAAFQYWLVADLPALEQMGLDVKSIGYTGGTAPWWRRGKKMEPLNEGLATVLDDALENGEAFALPAGGPPVLTVLANVSPRAAARENTENFLRTLYTTGWYTENDETTQATLPLLLGAWCSEDGVEQVCTNCLRRNLFGRPLEQVDYAVETVLLTPGSEDVYDYVLTLRVSGENAKFPQAQVMGSVQVDALGRVAYFRHNFFQAGGYQCPGDLFLARTAWETGRLPVKKVS